LRQQQTTSNNQLIASTQQNDQALLKTMERDFGFEIDPNLPAWTNAAIILATKTAKQIDNQVLNMKYHNLCTHLQPPAGIQSILGFDLKHCVQLKTPDTKVEDILNRVERDVRIRYMHRDGLAPRSDNGSVSSSEEGYDPKIYVRLPDWEPEPCEDEALEKELLAFRKQVCSLVANNQPAPRSNLNKRQEAILSSLRSAKPFIIMPTDKNLGPAIMERTTYIKRCFNDHLLSKSTYKELNEHDAQVMRYNSRAAITQAAEKAIKYATIPLAERNYFSRSFREKRLRRPPQFYLLPKVHKTPMKTRPVVSCVGSFNEIASKWLDYKLAKVVHLCPSYTKDSYQILDEIKALGNLPPNARIFTADAVSMYTNIDASHGIETIGKWLELHRSEINKIDIDFHFDLVIQLLTIVMNNNVFQFDDCWFHQQNGTAMGTSVACVYATIYYSYHEETTLLPKYNSSLRFYRRFIDDVLAIWIPPENRPIETWTAFKTDLSFGLLRWETEALSTSVNFLDLTISFTPTNSLTTRTFQKTMNLYLYLCPSSSHPPGVWKGLIYGSIRRFWLQNSDPIDYRNVVSAFFRQLCNRGHDPAKIAPLFIEGAHSVDRKLNPKTTPHRAPTAKPTPSDRPLFFHLQYHPLEVPNSEIYKAFEECCPEIREQLHVNRFVIAHSRQPNLRDLLCKTQMDEPPGSRASNLLLQLRSSQLPKPN
jgi:hypothetical protein